MSRPRGAALHNISGAVKSNLLLASFVTPFSTKMPLSQISALLLLNVQICGVTLVMMLCMIGPTCFESLLLS